MSSANDEASHEVVESDHRLQRIFERYGTDKGSLGYADLYECLFVRQRMRVRAVLEIGIGTLKPEAHSSMVGFCLPGYRPGGSLRAWREFVPAAQIYGVDVQDDTMLTQEARIKTYLCNSTDASQVDKTFVAMSHERFDLIVDDGSHTLDDQIATFRNFFPRVAAGGCYVIEDIWREALTARVDELIAISGDNPRFFLTLKGSLWVCCKATG